MTLTEFIEKHDRDKAIVLLEGKRKVADEDQDKLFALGKLLAHQTEKMIFRSGNAAGSDQFFSEGIAAVDHTRLQVITPYDNHRKKTNKAYETVSMDSIDLASEPELLYQSKGNKKMEKLIDQYASGQRGRFAIKAAYIIRDTVKAIGTETISPATFGIFYDDLNNPMSGGTGHTMQICKQNEIPIIDQNVWMKWLDTN
ncbi:MAG: hypothetical protein EA362_05175 [Saprospirales bacterium]|nr:MAG: hypothetical protein EA362_05175 [Saprospirales bacterium]